MTMYECSNLIVGLLTFGALFWTLVVLRGYARDTKNLRAWRSRHYRDHALSCTDQLTLQTRRFSMEQLLL